MNNHKSAVMATCIFARYYVIHGGDSMAFWASLSETEQQTCRDLVERLEQAPPESVITANMLKFNINSPIEVKFKKGVSDYILNEYKPDAEGWSKISLPTLIFIIKTTGASMCDTIEPYIVLCDSKNQTF